MIANLPFALPPAAHHPDDDADHDQVHQGAGPFDIDPLLNLAPRPIPMARDPHHSEPDGRHGRHEADLRVDPIR